MFGLDLSKHLVSYISRFVINYLYEYSIRYFCFPCSAFFSSSICSILVYLEPLNFGLVLLLCPQAKSVWFFSKKGKINHMTDLWYNELNFVLHISHIICHYLHLFVCLFILFLCLNFFLWLLLNRTQIWDNEFLKDGFYYILCIIFRVFLFCLSNIFPKIVFKVRKIHKQKNYLIFFI